MSPEIKLYLIVQKLQKLDSKITLSQMRLLTEVINSPGEAFSYYTDKIGITRASLSLSLKVLSEGKDLLRESYGVDGRSKSLYPTDKTKTVFKECYEILIK